MKTRILSLSLILLSIGCTKENISPPNKGQEIYFQVEGLNYAWGFYHAGIMIDSSGYVRGYNLPAKWNWIDSLGYISNSQMKENIEQLDTTYSKIDRDTLQKYINLIYKASKGAITTPVTQMWDAGITSFTAYLYDSNSQKYKQVLIKQTGDQFIDNKSREANQIYNWLIRRK